MAPLRKHTKNYTGAPKFAERYITPQQLMDMIKKVKGKIKKNSNLWNRCRKP